jgi:hypothetical protein
MLAKEQLSSMEAAAAVMQGIVDGLEGFHCRCMLT